MHAWGAEHEPDADDLLLFIASTGWRFSECTPVTPAAVEDQGDVELDDGTVLPLVWVSVLGVHRRDEDDRIFYAEGEGKSQAAIRRVNLPPRPRAWSAGGWSGSGPSDLVFTNRHGSQWRSNNFLDREFAGSSTAPASRRSRAWARTTCATPTSGCSTAPASAWPRPSAASATRTSAPPSASTAA
jgi:hypothetical protein